MRWISNTSAPWIMASLRTFIALSWLNWVERLNVPVRLCWEKWPPQCLSWPQAGCDDLCDEFQAMSRRHITWDDWVGKVLVLHDRGQSLCHCNCSHLPPETCQQGIPPMNGTNELAGTSFHCSPHQQKVTSIFWIHGKISAQDETMHASDW